MSSTFLHDLRSVKRVADEGSLGRLLKTARTAVGLQQDEVADKLDVSRVSVSNWERDENRPTDDNLRQLAGLYRVNFADLKNGRLVSRPDDVASGSVEPFSPKPALARNLPDRAHQIVLGYLERLERAGLSVDQLEEMERLLLDDRYAKQYSRRHHVEWTEEDHILHVESLWQAIRDALATQGIVP